MVSNMYGMRNGLRPEEQPAKRLKPSQVQAVMKGNHGTSLVEAMSAEEIQSHLENLRVRFADQAAVHCLGNCRGRRITSSSASCC